MGDLGRRLLELLGERGCVELLAVLELDEPERAALIGQLYASERGARRSPRCSSTWRPTPTTSPGSG